MFEICGTPGSERSVGDCEVRVELLKDEEGVGDADGAFEEAAAGFEGGWWVGCYEAREGGFELAAGVCGRKLLVGWVEVFRDVRYITSPRHLGIVLEVARRHADWICSVWCG